MTLQIIIGLLLRHILTAIGGGAFIQGLMTDDIINQTAGVVAGLVGVGLSALNKKKK